MSPSGLITIKAAIINFSVVDTTVDTVVACGRKYASCLSICEEITSSGMRGDLSGNRKPPLFKPTQKTRRRTRISRERNDVSHLQQTELQDIAITGLKHEMVLLFMSTPMSQNRFCSLRGVYCNILQALLDYFQCMSRSKRSK